MYMSSTRKYLFIVIGFEGDHMFEGNEYLQMSDMETSYNIYIHSFINKHHTKCLQ